MHEEDLKFIKNLNNMLSNIYDKKVTYKFLDLHKQEIVNYVLKSYKDINYLLYGGFENSLYKRAVFSKGELSESDCLVKVFKINYNQKYLNLTHQNVLGTLLSLGITKDSIGDVVITDFVYFACCDEVKSYIKDNFTKVNNSKVEIEESKEIISSLCELKSSVYTISSLRIDCVLSGVYNISRNESKNLITLGFVRVNFSQCLETSFILKENDFVSIRKYGRIKILNILGKSRKDKIRVEIGKTFK